jgi:hypothetical protein
MNDLRFPLSRPAHLPSISFVRGSAKGSFRWVISLRVALSMVGLVTHWTSGTAAEETAPAIPTENSAAASPEEKPRSDSAADLIATEPDKTATTNSVPSPNSTVSDSTKTDELTTAAKQSGEKQDSRSRERERERERRRRERSGASPSESMSESKTNAAAFSKSDFAAYKIITDRNIFSPSRTTPSAVTTETRRVPKVDSFWLVGTMSYDKGDFAFFDGSDGDYRKAIKVPGAIAGHTITEVTADEVTLEFEGKALKMRMGSQRRREDDGTWESRAGSTILSTSTGDSPTSGSESGTESSSGGAEDEILQRLLKKREQELKNEKP